MPQIFKTIWERILPKKKKRKYCKYYNFTALIPDTKYLYYVSYTDSLAKLHS